MRKNAGWTLLSAIVLTAPLLVFWACGSDNDGPAQPTEVQNVATDDLDGGAATVPPASTTEVPGNDTTDEAPFAILDGDWVGMWNNDTYSTTAPITLNVTINDDGTASITLGLSSTAEGAPFGLPPVDPSTLEGTIEGDILNVEASRHPVFGNITISILANGTFEALATMEGVPGVAGLEVDGIFDEDGMDGTYTITFPDGSEAVGSAYLNRV